MNPHQKPASHISHQISKEGNRVACQLPNNTNVVNMPDDGPMAGYALAALSDGITFVRVLREDA